MKRSFSWEASTIAVVGVILAMTSGLLADAQSVTTPTGNPVIIVAPGGGSGDFELKPDTPGQWIELLVVGGMEVAGCNFNAQIGDGGPEAGAGGTPGPIITSVDLEGSAENPTIFFGNNHDQNDLGSIPQLATYSIIAEIGTVPADGVLARLEIDTSGFTGDQTWTLALNVTLNGPTDFAPIPADITDGAIHIPEPMTMTIFALGGLAVVRRRRRR